MSRVVLRLVLDVVLTVALAWGFLALWQWMLSGLSSNAFPEATRVLFNFMDVGLGIWVVLLIIWTIRGGIRRSGGLSAARTFLFVLIGAVVNLLVVTVVAFIQGGWAPFLVVFAIEAGIVVLIAAAIVVPIVHRAVRRPPDSPAP